MKVGDLIIWTDGTPGILLNRFDMYTRDDGARYSTVPAWCWRIAFNGPTPRDYNEKWGALETNLRNQGMVRRARVSGYKCGGVESTFTPTE